MRDVIVEVQNLSVSLSGRRVLEDINFTISEGDFVGVIGPNGAGKSMLLKAIVGLVPLESGSVKVRGKSYRENPGVVGYVPQFPTFKRGYPITVLEVVLMGRLARKGLFRRFNSDDSRLAMRCLELVELSDRSGDEVSNLSGGQIQRVLIARALASEPELLLFDEPTASLDTAIGRNFYSLLDDLAKEKAIVLISHDIGVIGRHVKTVACLNRKMHYHHSKEISGAVLEEVYGCPVELVAHGYAPHRVFEHHTHGEGEPHDH